MPKSHNTGQVVDFAAVPTDVPSTRAPAGADRPRARPDVHVHRHRLEDSLLTVHNFGGATLLLHRLHDSTEICCPSKDADGNDIIVTVEHDEAAYKFNLCDPDVTESFRLTASRRSTAWTRSR